MPPENLAGRKIAGYELLERIGEGGTAEVYRARHAQHGLCAFKVLRTRLRSDPTAVKRFLREASYGRRVEHPGVVRTYDFGEADGFQFLALEWANGQPLSHPIQQNGPLAPGVVAGIVDPLADALACAHAAGIIHRDLKPENILYDSATGTVKLLDFGIAQDTDLPPDERLTRTGFFVGTIQYVAPEALSGELVDSRADIYSLATITYYLLTGRHPFGGHSPRELFQQLLTASPVRLNKAVPGLVFASELETAVMKGLARNAADRQATVRSFADDVMRGSAAEKPRRGFFSVLRRK
jgi:serine/threonine protein kinase